MYDAFGINYQGDCFSYKRGMPSALNRYFLT